MLVVSAIIAVPSTEIPLKEPGRGVCLMDLSIGAVKAIWVCALLVTGTAGLVMTARVAITGFVTPIFALVALIMLFVGMAASFGKSDIHDAGYRYSLVRGIDGKEGEAQEKPGRNGMLCMLVLLAAVYLAWLYRKNSVAIYAETAMRACEPGTSWHPIRPGAISTGSIHGCSWRRPPS